VGPGPRTSRKVLETFSVQRNRHRVPPGTFTFKKHPSKMSDDEVDELAAVIYDDLVVKLDESAPLR
jgi:hypothetical protein